MMSVVSFDPSPTWETPRSYMRGVEIGLGAIWSLLSADNPVMLNTFSGGYESIAVYEFDPRFWAWSSNYYSLDHVLVDSYVWNVVTGASVHYDLAVAVNAVVNPLTACRYVHIGHASETRLWRINLPSTPLPYWLPTLPCPEILT